MNKAQHTTRYIKHLAESANFKGSTFNKHCNGLIGNRFEMPNVSYTHPLAPIDMKKRHFILRILIFIVITSCANKQTGNIIRPVLLKTYEHNRLRKTDSLQLEISLSNGILNYIYTYDKDTLGLSFTKSKNCDSVLTQFSIECPLVASKTFTINRKEYQILKYYYNVENAQDEETNYFYSEKYGLLVGSNNTIFNLFFTIEYDNLSQVLIDSIINDRTGFYAIEMIPPPPENQINNE